MNYQVIAVIAGLVVLNLLAVWILFLRGGAWLEDTGLFTWQTRRQWRGDVPTMSAGVFKLLAGAFLVLELVVAVIGLLAR